MTLWQMVGLVGACILSCILIVGFLLARDELMEKERDPK